MQDQTAFFATCFGGQFSKTGCCRLIGPKLGTPLRDHWMAAFVRWQAGREVEWVLPSRLSPRLIPYDLIPRAGVASIASHGSFPLLASFRSHGAGHDGSGAA